MSVGGTIGKVARIRQNPAATFELFEERAFEQSIATAGDRA
jgi:hypothetical protein